MMLTKKNPKLQACLLTTMFQMRIMFLWIHQHAAYYSGHYCLNELKRLVKKVYNFACSDAIIKERCTFVFKFD